MKHLEKKRAFWSEQKAAKKKQKEAGRKSKPLYFLRY